MHFSRSFLRSAWVRLAVLTLLTAILAPAAISQPLSLREAIDMALQRNPVMRASAAWTEVQKGRFWQAVSPPSPTVSIDHDFIPAGSPISGYGERSIRIEQSMEFPLVMISNASAAKTDVAVAESESRTAALALATQVKMAYALVLACGSMMSLARENAAIADTFAMQAETRYNAGEATNLERLTARVQRSQAATDVEVALHEWQSAIHTLRTICLGTTDAQDAEFTLSDSLGFDPISTAIDSSGFASDDHPEIEAAERRVRKARIEKTQSWLRLFPSLTASYATQRESGMGGLYGIGLGISIPLWFLFEHRGRIEEATARSDIAEAELSAVRNRTHADVRTTLLDLHIAEHQVTMYRDDVLPGAEETYRSASIHYRSGEISYLEYLQSRQTVISARKTHVDALLAYHNAKARLEYSLGIMYGLSDRVQGTR